MDADGGGGAEDRSRGLGAHLQGDREPEKGADVRFAPVTDPCDFKGLPERVCGDHFTTGQRAWCFDDSEWCFPNAPCRGCEIPGIREENDRMREALELIAGFAGPSDEAAIARAALGENVA